MKTSIIVAAAANDVIGNNNDLIWHLPKDLQFFKKMTLGHFMLMGKNTFLALGKPLPKRVHLIVSSTLEYDHERVFIFKSIEEAIEYARSQNEEELFITGGGKVYQHFLDENLVDKVYLTRVHESFEGDTSFKGFSESEWKLLTSIENPKDEKHVHAFTFLQYAHRSK